MIANVYNGPITNHATNGSYGNYITLPYITGTSTYDNRVPRGYQRPMSRRERALAAERERLAEEIRRFGDSALVKRVASAEREKKAMLDAKSRGRSAPAATRKKDARRLQTFDAAMHERQMRR